MPSSTLEGFLRLSHLTTMKTRLANPAKTTLGNAHQSEGSFPDLVSSLPREWYISQTIYMPDIGLRASQGHSIRKDMGPGYLISAQEYLSLKTI